MDIDERRVPMPPHHDQMHPVLPLEVEGHH
jgi:hypothetical protein